MTVWAHVIPFGDSTWTLPLAVSMAVALLLRGYPGGAVRWLICFGAGIALIVAGKLVFDLGGWYLPSLGFYSISGHAMQATAIYPLLFMMTLSVFGARAGRWGFYLGLGASAFMAVTLLAGDYHTLFETLAGMAVGAVVVCSYRHWKIMLRPADLSLLAILPLSVALIVDMHGTVNPTKAALWLKVAHWLGANQQYTRQIYTDPKTGLQQVTVRLRDIL